MSIRWRLGLAAMLMLAAAGAETEERRITVAASPELIESGLLKHMLPRFSLKTSIRTTSVPLEPGMTPMYRSGWRWMGVAPSSGLSRVRIFG